MLDSFGIQAPQNEELVEVARGWQSLRHSTPLPVNRVTTWLNTYNNNISIFDYFKQTKGNHVDYSIKAMLNILLCNVAARTPEVRRRARAITAFTRKAFRLDTR